MQVMQGKNTMISKQQDELAYLKFVEDLCRFSLSSPAHYPLLLTVKTCLHKCFLSQPRYIDAVITGIKTCVAKLKDKGDTGKEDLDLLNFCVEKLELKQSGGDKSVIVAIKEEDKVEGVKPPQFASADKNKLRTRGLAQGNKFISEEVKKEEVEEEEELKPKKQSSGGPKKSVAATGDLEPSMIGKKRVLAMQKKDLPLAPKSNENKNSANKQSERSRSASRASGKEAPVAN